jgi:hypothetical protein
MFHVCSVFVSIKGTFSRHNRPLIISYKFYSFISIVPIHVECLSSFTSRNNFFGHCSFYKNQSSKVLSACQFYLEKVLKIVSFEIICKKKFKKHKHTPLKVQIYQLKIDCGNFLVVFLPVGGLPPLCLGMRHL